MDKYERANAVCAALADIRRCKAEAEAKLNAAQVEIGRLYRAGELCADGAKFEREQAKHDYRETLERLEWDRAELTLL